MWHHLNHTSYMNLCEFLFVAYKRHTLYGWLRTIFCVVCFFMCLCTGWDNTWFLFFTFLNIQNEPYDVTLTLGNKSHNIPSQLLYVCFQKQKYIYHPYYYTKSIFIYLSLLFVFRNVLGHFSSMYTADTSWSSTVWKAVFCLK